MRGALITWSGLNGVTTDGLANQPAKPVQFNFRGALTTVFLHLDGVDGIRVVLIESPTNAVETILAFVHEGHDLLTHDGREGQLVLGEDDRPGLCLDHQTLVHVKVSALRAVFGEAIVTRSETHNLGDIAELVTDRDRHFICRRILDGCIHTDNPKTLKYPIEEPIGCCSRQTVERYFKEHSTTSIITYINVMSSKEKGAL